MNVLQTAGLMCSGHGTCDCGECRCDPGWGGDTCDCALDPDTCVSPYDGEVCSGHDKHQTSSSKTNHVSSI